MKEKVAVTTPIDAGELVPDNYTKIPNWFFSSILPTAPPSFSCLLVYLLRKTVGWSGAKRGGLDTWYSRSKDVADSCGIDNEVTSRWLHVLNAVGWFEYLPSKGDGKSQFKLLRMAEPLEAFCVGLAIKRALSREREWAGANKWKQNGRTRHPHVPAKGFVETFQSELSKVQAEPATKTKWTFVGAAVNQRNTSG